MHHSHRKEHLLSYLIPAPQKPRNAHSATTATTPETGIHNLRIHWNSTSRSCLDCDWTLSVGRWMLDVSPSVASIADNPFPFRKDFKIKRLRNGIIGDARSPIIAHYILRRNAQQLQQLPPNGPTSPVASIADNPFPSRNDFKIKRLRCGIIGDARSPIIAHHISVECATTATTPAEWMALPEPHGSAVSPRVTIGHCKTYAHAARKSKGRGDHPTTLPAAQRNEQFTDVLQSFDNFPPAMRHAGNR